MSLKCVVISLSLKGFITAFGQNGQPSLIMATTASARTSVEQKCEYPRRTEHGATAVDTPLVWRQHAL